MENKTLYPWAWTTFLLICMFADQVVQADLITETCKKSYSVSMCEPIFRSDPRSAGAKDVKGLAKILLDICIGNATETLNVIKKLQASDPNLEQLLSRCASDYKLMIEDDFGGAKKKLDENAYKEAAKLAFYGGARGPVDCEGTYKDKKGSPIRQRNTDIAYLGLLARSIILLIPS